MNTRMIDVVFPADTNHHGTLFGGIGLAQMDKVAFIAASRRGRVGFVTASCEHIDFRAPAYMGEIIELTGNVVHAGKRSLSVQVDLIAEEPLTGERRHCSRGVFNMVAMIDKNDSAFSLSDIPAEKEHADASLRIMEVVFPQRTSHHGSLCDGDILAAMSKASFVAATRHCRKRVVLASCRGVNFASPIYGGEIVELAARVDNVGKASLTIGISVWAEKLQTGERRQCGEGEFIMVAVDETHRPIVLS